MGQFDETARVTGLRPPTANDREGPPSDPLVGQILGSSYRILRLVGRGGMGVVYEASHVRLPRRYAVKILRQVLASEHEAFARFRREAEIASSLGSHHIAEVFDFNTMDDGTPFIVMEFLEGEDLGRVIEQRGKLAPDEALHICEQVASALSTAHSRQIVHRDIKPDNIFLCPDAQGQRLVKLVDFGVSKIRDATGANLTQSQTWIGTPAFMSPEQASGGGRSVDPRSDIYSLGAVMYVALTGRYPFEGDTFFALVQKIMNEPPPSVLAHVPHLPEGVDEVLRAALAKNPAHRPATAEQLYAELKAAFERKTTGRGTKSARIARVEPDVLGTFSGLEPLSLPASRKRPSLGMGLLALGAAACLLVVILYARSSRSTSTALPPAAPVAPVAQAPVAAAEARIRLEIESVPAGAEVWRVADGIRVGKTPFVHEMAPSSGDAVFLVRHPGHEDARVELPADRDGKKIVMLTPVSAPPGPAIRKPSKGSSHTVPPPPAAKLPPAEMAPVPAESSKEPAVEPKPEAKPEEPKASEAVKPEEPAAKPADEAPSDPAPEAPAETP